MNCLWNFFENADELAYVSDMDSYEILYMNHSTLEAYGVSSVDAFKGRHCYEVLYGNNSPCVICHSERLREGKYLKQKFFNPLLDRYFLLMDTIVRKNGIRCRFELAIDISEYENTRREDIEARINEGIRYAICEPDPNTSIHIILEFLGKALNAERAYIVERSASGGKKHTYVWAVTDLILEGNGSQNPSGEILENGYCFFSKNPNSIFICDDVEKMRYSSPSQYRVLKRQNIHSIVIVPLYDGCRIIGFYGIDNPPKQDLNCIRNMFQIVGGFISSMLKRRDIMGQLSEMSLSDQLTLLGNRYAMNEYIAGIKNAKSLGVVFCDITGLKIINDTMGHKAGDELICRTVECLKYALGDYGLFRIGGDELLALCVNIEENILQERITLLREKAAQNSVNLAVGAVWEAQCRDNLQGLIDKAEKLMYKEKREYYQRTGIDRRR